ncbi:MAG: tetratricopeptide repeat protein [Candidatus Hydrogenedentes bacterium]|nr:tetratricopeptide repeat protein [Candidatus Hydrogenedentota bacterium]
MRKNEELSLAKILVYLFLAAGMVAGSLWVWRWYKHARPSGMVEATALTALETAQQLYGAGKLAEARQTLQPVVEQARSPEVVPSALLLLARIEQQAGNRDAALALLKRSATEFPTSAEQPQAKLAHARLLEDSEQWQEASAHYEEIRANAPAELRAPALCGLGRQRERDGELLGARELYREALDDAAWKGEAWNEALRHLGPVNVATILGRKATPESQVYVVEKGDSLNTIGLKLNTTMGLLTRANALDEDAILQVGQRLKYTPKEFRIVVERSTCRLYLLDKEGLFKSYSCGLGMPGHETTLGTYKIGNKEKNPVWHKPGEGPIPFGDPRNELGTRWMPLVPDEANLPQDLGIHGTVRPETVGAYASHGCARLIKDEVEELYDLVVRATPVEIVEVFEPASAGS